MVKLTQLILCGTLLLVFQSNSFATSYYVNDNATTGDFYCSTTGNNANNGLSAATPKATLTNLLTTYSGTLTSGDVIYIDAGTYNDKNLTLNIAGISIIGAGPAKTIFDNNWASADANRLFNITANNITIQGIYITKYNYGFGGASAVQISGVTGIVFTNVLTDENHPGGGSSTIVIDGGSSVTFNGGGSNCNSTTSVAGGGVNVEGNGNTVIFNDYSFSNNSKDFQGGSGLYIVGNNTTSVTVNNSIFSDNRNTSDGGAIYISGANLNVSGSCFSGNTTSAGSGPKYGGAVTVGRGATLTFTNCTFTNNAVSNSGNGGAISINTSYAGSGTTATVNLNTCTFTGNSSNASGHHLYARVGSSNAAIFNINNCTFTASGQDIRNGNSATINVQNSGSPSTSGTVNFINTTAPSSTAVTSCPVLQGSCYGVILPVELINFSAQCESSYAHLSWSTASEQNNEYFTIERAGENANFEIVTTVEAQHTTTQKTDYVLNDFAVEPGINYYRLSQTDVDGFKRVVSTISLNNTCIDEEFAISAAYIPSEQAMQLAYFTKKNEDFTIEIYNAAGQLILSADAVFHSEERLHVLPLNAPLSEGVYFVRVANERMMISDKVLVAR